MNSTRQSRKLATFKAWKKRNPDYFKLWAEKNREKTRAAVKKWRQKNKKYCAIKMNERREKYPWEQSHYAARNRCTNEKSERFYRYGARGIKFLLTIKETKILWERDMADQMTRPSIDRIDNDGHYELSNCRFIELSENIGKRNKIHRFQGGYHASR